MDATLLLGIVQGLLTILCGIIAWAHIDVKKKTENLEKDLSAYKLMVAEKYVSSDELKDAIAGLNKSFENYSNKWDHRMDKLEDKIEKMRE